MASTLPKLNEVVNSSCEPIIKATPEIAITVPIQKNAFGLYFQNSKAPIPTHTGERLARIVEILAFDITMDEFHNAISQAKKKPQSIAKNTPRILVMGFRQINQMGSIPADAMAIR
jgi:hypothetical protein